MLRMLNDLNSEGKLLADDAKIYWQIKDIADNEWLQEDLDKLQEWSTKWLLKFNRQKCKVMNFGTKNPKVVYSMGDVQLTPSDQEQDLGVLFTPNLKSSAQVARAASIANYVLGRIKKTFTCLNDNTVPALYKALV